MITEKVESTKAILPESVGDIFGLKGESKKMTMTVSFREDSKCVDILYVTGDGKANDVCLNPGDQLNFSHDVKLVFLKHVPVKDGAFPIEIEFNGQEYKLNKTKNGKLLLTK